MVEMLQQQKHFILVYEYKHGCHEAEEQTFKEQYPVVLFAYFKTKI